MQLIAHPALLLIRGLSRILWLAPEVTKLKYLIACFPKSGSTYLSELIGSLEGFQKVSWVPAYGHREQELDDRLIEQHSSDISQVAQHHVRASEYTLELIDRYDIIPIILVRNIFDCMVSLADHTEAESEVYPMGYVQNKIRNVSFEERLDAIVDLTSPWYINFFASWFETRPANIVQFEDVVINDAENRSQFFQRFGLPWSADQMTQSTNSVERKSTRFNVGITGRGLNLLSPSQITRIRRFTNHYENIDFSMIGL